MIYKEQAVIFDADGVLLNTSYIFEEIFKLKLKGDEKWDYFKKHCNSERTQAFRDILDLWFALSGRFKVFVSTARNEKCKEETPAKLQRSYFFIPNENLLMRKDGDYRESQEVKKDHLLQIMKDYDIIAFIDDDLKNCEMARDLGVLALRKVT